MAQDNQFVEKSYPTASQPLPGYAIPVADPPPPLIGQGVQSPYDYGYPSTGQPTYPAGYNAPLPPDYGHMPAGQPAHPANYGTQSMQATLSGATMSPHLSVHLLCIDGHGHNWQKDYTCCGICWAIACFPIEQTSQSDFKPQNSIWIANCDCDYWTPAKITK
ncbi:hypothetical protein THASP1DRAFT_25768 [Thamnocephalis sphaerospora]|uniref:Uncharacterized protein n=1 Tax=Thamnocephalis sphaerospora TaxID=78915 RepID=A0A4P9XJ77_9FUNG|nr:hypothetical protein THASP1DRAFT_25768 [Thamnocephalis sphaerospora]|eukprot:RKP05797.1 hypothetical protein THASP1DRAFT_25768 [Thamnocephalis sphaerospora]